MPLVSVVLEIKLPSREYRPLLRILRKMRANADRAYRVAKRTISNEEDDCTQDRLTSDPGNRQLTSDARSCVGYKKTKDQAMVLS